VYFEIVGSIENVEVIAVGGRVRDIIRLRSQDGSGRWRKLKGIATVRLGDGRLRKTEGKLVRSPWYWPEEDENQAISGLKI
jgi:hypothetical protein